MALSADFIAFAAMETGRTSNQRFECRLRACKGDFIRAGSGPAAGAHCLGGRRRGAALRQRAAVRLGDAGLDRNRRTGGRRAPCLRSDEFDWRSNCPKGVAKIVVGTSPRAVQVLTHLSLANAPDYALSGKNWMKWRGKRNRCKRPARLSCANANMKLLFVHDRFGSFGGAESNIAAVAQAFREKGHRTAILHGPGTGQGEERWRQIFEHRQPFGAGRKCEPIQAAL